MCSYKSDVNKANTELYYGNKSEFISFDVEYIPLVAHIVNAVENLTDVGQTLPFAFLHHLAPDLQGSLRRRVLLRKLSESLLCKDSHNLCHVAKVILNSVFQNIIL